MRRILPVFILLFLLGIQVLNPLTVFSQAPLPGDLSLGIATYLPLIDEEVEDGDIVSYSPRGYYITNLPYDAAMVGIISLNPAVALETTDLENAQPVIFTGNVGINVVTSNGPIKNGDLITSSDVKGAGMKATRAGYVLGTALADYNNPDPTVVGKVPVSLNIHYFFSETRVQTGLLDFFSLASLATYEQPTVVFKYLIAGLVVLMTCILGFLSFGRIANTGIQAVGRNPLASSKIQFAIILNVFLTIVIIGSGLAVAYFVLNI